MSRFHLVWLNQSLTEPFQPLFEIVYACEVSKLSRNFENANYLFSDLPHSLFHSPVAVRMLCDTQSHATSSKCELFSFFKLKCVAKMRGKKSSTSDYAWTRDNQ